MLSRRDGGRRSVPDEDGRERGAGVPGLIARIDARQRRNPWLGFPLAVFYKFVDGRGAVQAALITYFAFLSLFPLLLVCGTGLRIALHDDPALQRQLLGTALARLPVVGEELTAAVHPLEGSGIALAVGIAVAVYGGLGFTVAIENTFNHVWAVPMDLRPHTLVARMRGVAVLLVLVGGVALTTALAAVGETPGTYGVDLGVPGQVLAVALSLAVNIALFLVAFRRLTVRPLTLRQVLPGAVAAAVGWQVLQGIGVFVVAEDPPNEDPLYGPFALVLALLAWIYIEALIVVVAAEVNAVLVDRLWPRSLLAIITPAVALDTLTEADRRCYRAYAGSQRFQRAETIAVEFVPLPDEREERS
jgi:membrane protein